MGEIGLRIRFAATDDAHGAYVAVRHTYATGNTAHGVLGADDFGVVAEYHIVNLRAHTEGAEEAGVAVIDFALQIVNHMAATEEETVEGLALRADGLPVLLRVEIYVVVEVKLAMPFISLILKYLINLKN